MNDRAKKLWPNLQLFVSSLGSDAVKYQSLKKKINSHFISENEDNALFFEYFKIYLNATHKKWKQLS